MDDINEIIPDPPVDDDTEAKSADEAFVEAEVEAEIEAEEPAPEPIPLVSVKLPRSRVFTEEIISIAEFDPNTIKGPGEDGSKIVIIGKPGSGKSYLLDSLMYSKKHIFPSAVVVSGTEESNNFFSRRVSPLFIYSALNLDIINNVVKRQRVAKKHIDDPWLMLILDDCMDDPKYFRSAVFSALFKNSRHWSMNTYLAMQYAVDIPPAIRTCVDYCFIFRETSFRNRKILYENYASIIPSYEIFNAIMDQITGDYTCLVINNRSTSNDYRDCIFYYKAPQVPDYVIGSDDYYKFANKRLDEQDDE